ncbi:MAG: uroporphyrinogen decarboxylase [Micavibrio sp.]|nr:uroporphyrinogen decarboxylase [Micavibrio sp.]
MKSLIRVLKNKEPLSVPPVWFMRQAGRYLPEYLRLREEKGSFLNLVYDPGFAAEVTVQPIRRFGMNGAILFSDILIIPHALGQDLEFRKGEGPVLDPISDAGDFSKLSMDHLDERLSSIYHTVENVGNLLSEENFEDTALIGFAGAPWTVACYMVQGHGKCDFPKTRAFARKDPEGFQTLVDVVEQATLIYLKGQIEAGAEAIQLFDSWADLLEGDEFERWVIEPAERIFTELKKTYPDIPLIGFAKTADEARLIDYSKITSMDCMGLGQDVNLEIVKKLPDTLAVQGNLDPESLLEGGQRMERDIRNILDICKGRPHVFNLGHGVIKETAPENVARAVEIIRGDA